MSFPDSDHCDIPPDGWYCTLSSGHTGPCAALPEEPFCCRCMSACGLEGLKPAPCVEDPEKLLGQPIGMYHCPDCGAMVMAGFPHPELCVECINEINKEQS